MKIKNLNKKGFTLIELLAVIVVLAIILVLVVPNVLDTVNNSKKGVARDQAMLIFKAAETCVATEQALGKSVSDSINSCKTLDGLVTNKYYKKNGSETATFTIASDGTVNTMQYLEKTGTSNVMCAYSSDVGKQNIVGGITSTEVSSVDNVSSSNCK